MSVRKYLLSILAVTLSFFSFGGCENHDEVSIVKSRHYWESMAVDGHQREYLLNLPPQYGIDSAAFPLVIGLHGFGGSGDQFERSYHFSEKADEAGFIAVYPNGIRDNGRFDMREWNAGGCCGTAISDDINDVKFIDQLIDKLINNYRIDPKRVYVTGMSNGGMMAYRLAAEIPDKIAAIAPVSCTMVFDPPSEQARAMPILHLHSALDDIVPYAGTTNALGYYFPPVDSVLTVWAIRDGCSPKAQVLVDNAQYKEIQWLNAASEPLIVYYLTKDGGHSWPGGDQVRPGAALPSTVIDANDLIWAFFKQYSLP